MTGESAGLISAMGALLDRVRKTLVQLNRDQAPDPSEGLEAHHLAVAASAGDQRTLGLLWVADKTNPAVHAFDMSVLTALHAEWLAPMIGIA